jgi:hypothetical protein
MRRLGRSSSKDNHHKEKEGNTNNNKDYSEMLSDLLLDTKSIKP